MMKRDKKERGSVNGWMVGTIGCLILFLIAGSLAIWAYMQYSHEKSNVDSKVAIEVAKGKSEQAESDQKKFSEIINKNLDTVLNDYQSRLKKGELTSSSTEFNGISATRIDGTFEKELRGSVVLMKVRDKTIRFSTDADTFKPDFQTILGTVKIAE